jgi:hypothetical protein
MPRRQGRVDEDEGAPDKSRVAAGFSLPESALSMR